ncbi:MAG: hypothetical protein AAF583_00275 [Pseudomonadota bacterium]
MKVIPVIAIATCLAAFCACGGPDGPVEEIAEEVDFRVEPQVETEPGVIEALDDVEENIQAASEELAGTIDN